MSDASEHDEQFEVVVGRKAPLTMVPDWVTLFPGSKKSPMYRGKILSPQAKAVYNVLAMHVNVERGDSACWPSRETIADICGFSREQSVDPYLDQLDEADAIDREPIIRPNGAMGIRYIVHQMPPPGYDGEQNIGEYHKRRRKEKAQKQTRPPGRPRKTTAPAAEPAVPDTPAEEKTQERPPAARKAPAKKAAAPRKAAATKKAAPAKKTAAKRAAPKEKTPEEIALDELAEKAAQSWWAEAEKMVANNDMGPLMATGKARSGKYLNLRTRLRAAFAAGYDKREIWRALHALREWSPAEWQWNKALEDVRGVRARPRPGGPKPLFRNDQWQKDDTPPNTEAPRASAAPDISEFGLQAI
ncbi:hypothetical protein AB0G49_14065 [Streptomyces longwoodensis]|uniref:hypothetical protein n=1 Tax=Streptomyces longwoodensis TaxID=68231 RepID=UPI0033CD39CA